MSANVLLEPNRRRIITFHHRSSVGYCRDYGVLFIELSQPQIELSQPQIELSQPQIDTNGEERYDYYFGYLYGDNHVFQTLTDPLTRTAKDGVVTLKGRIPSERCVLKLSFRIGKRGNLKFKGKKKYDSLFTSNVSEALHRKGDDCFYQD